MKFLHRSFFIVFTLFSLLHTTVSSTFAMSVEPFAPFSIEGNPDEAYQFNEIFPLFVYINAPDFEIYENKERSRSYEDIEMCAGGDSERDDECDNQGDKCTGGPVKMCHRGGGYSHTLQSKNGSCKLFNGGRNVAPSEQGELLEGRCEYTQTPKISTKVQGTDFSVNETLAYPKIQSESLAYSNVGTDNAITWGSSHLSLTYSDKLKAQLIVVTRAKQTQDTVSSTGQWPLGWVDWGYLTKNGKSLLTIYEQIPTNITTATKKIIESNDNFYISGGDLSKLLDTSKEESLIISEIAKVGYHLPQPQWLMDLQQAPLYPPSYRQGFVRPSICVWKVCCPTFRCPEDIVDLIKGSKRGLYYDISVSETYNAALADLFVTYSLDGGVSIFQELSKKNPLNRYLSTSTTRAIPSAIAKDLAIIIKGTCAAYNGWGNWLSFGTHMDYLSEGKPMGPGNTCPDYHLIDQLEKQTAAATSTNFLDAVIDMIWGKKVDDVDNVKYHLLTIPDAMGQSINELQDPVYYTKDTLAELEDIKEFNANMSNVVADDADNLFGGKISGPNNANRSVSAYYTCDDEMFSAQKLTSIEAYAMGTRVGCNQKDVPIGKCDSKKFAEIIKDSKWKMPSTQATSLVKGSSMFINGELNPDLEVAYAAAEKETGVPCEVLAGLHFSEASAYFLTLGGPEKRSNANGQPLERGQSLLDTSIISGNAILRHPINNTQKLIAAISNFNGGGNANCQLGFPASIPYGGCPRQFIGEDDPYATNLLDGRHTNMYLLYCGDFTPCLPPKIYGNDRPGAFSAALVVHEYLAARSSSYTPSPTDQPSQNVDPAIGAGFTPFFPKTCGEGSIGTALGCLPYTRDAFVSTLLSFIVGIAGAIALVIMLIATVQIMTAGGDAKKLAAARDLFFAAITGLLFLIFSVSLLRIIAGDIIKLPGF